MNRKLNLISFLILTTYLLGCKSENQVITPIITEDIEQSYNLNSNLILKATCADDVELYKVTSTLTNLNTGVVYWSFFVELNKVEIYNLNKSIKLEEKGKFELNVTSKDNQGGLASITKKFIVE